MSDATAAPLRERVADPERCQHGYLLTWKHCPMCKQDGVVLSAGTALRAVYTTLLVENAEARRDGCQECGGPLRRDLLAEARAVLDALEIPAATPSKGGAQ